MSNEKMLFEIAAKVDIMWAGMKIIYAMIGGQIVVTLVGILRGNTTHNCTNNKKDKNGNS